MHMHACLRGIVAPHHHQVSDTKLYKAAVNGFSRNVELFIRGGALVNAKNEAGATPLHLAAFAGHLKTVRVLIKYGANVNARDNEGNTPLWEAYLLKRMQVPTLKI